MADTVSVTQADRQLICDMMIPNSVPEQYRDAIMAGEWDSWKPIQTAAKHRLASTQPAPAFPREEVAQAYIAGFEQGWECDRNISPTDEAVRYARGYAALLQGKQP